MVFGLPAIGETSWGQKVLDSINAVKATADDALATADALGAPSQPLRPTAPLVDLAPTGAVVTVDSTSASHVSFPFTCTLRSGKHLVQYRAASTHGWVGDGVVRLKSSIDNGATWSAAWTMVDNAGEDDNGGGLVQLRDGTVVGLIVRRPTATQSGWYTQAVTSTDDGATWGTAVTLNAGASGFEYGTHLVALDNGEVLAFLYCNSGGDDYVVVMASADGGATWATRATIAGAAGTDYQEPQAVVMPDGEILAFLRTEVGTGPTRSLSMSRSTDNGVTWTTPTVILTNAGGQPAPHLTPNGLLVLAYRDHNAAAMAWRWATSTDRGDTWTTRGNFEATGNVMVYGGWLDLGDGDQGLVYANELLSDTTVSDTYFMRFGRTVDATVPLGQLDSSVGSNGNVLTKVGGVWSAAAPATGGAGATSLFVGAAELSSVFGAPSLANIDGSIPTYNMDAASVETVAGAIEIPSDWTTFNVKVWWAPTTADVGNVYFDGGRGWVTPGSAWTTTYVSAGLTAAPGVALGVVEHTLMTGVSRTGNVFGFRVVRIASDATDTYPADAAIIGVRFIKAT